MGHFRIKVRISLWQEDYIIMVCIHNIFVIKWIIIGNEVA